MKIPTFDSDGKPNGWLCPIWNANEHPEFRPDQVYLTAIAPHSRKGPHLHKVRRGMFACVRGKVGVRLLSGTTYLYVAMTPGSDPIIVLPGTPAALYNDTDEEALVINMPSPAWSKDDPDEWPVENWED